VIELQSSLVSLRILIEFNSCFFVSELSYNCFIVKNLFYNSLKSVIAILDACFSDMYLPPTCPGKPVIILFTFATSRLPVVFSVRNEATSFLVLTGAKWWVLVNID